MQRPRNCKLNILHGFILENQCYLLHYAYFVSSMVYANLDEGVEILQPLGCAACKVLAKKKKSGY